MPNKALAKSIYSLQNSVVRDLNDAHIFLEQAQPLLLQAKTGYEQSRARANRRYYVPSVGRRKFAKRTDAELEEIYSRYISTGLFEAFLVRSVSRFETFVADVTTTVLSHYPLRATENMPGVPPCPLVSLPELMKAQDREDLVQVVLATHVTNVLRQRPSVYLAYLAQLIGFKTDPSFPGYYEVVATRDLTVHNNSVVNRLYLEKAAANARGTLGERLIVDKTYYYGALARLKKVAGAIKREISEKFG